MNIERLPEQWPDGSPNAELGTLIDDPSLIKSVPEEQLVRLLSQLDGLRIAVLVRLISPALQPPAETTPVDGDQLLTVSEVAAKLAVDTSWIYRNKGKLPFTRRLSSGTLRFCARGLRKWLDTRK